MTDEDFAKIKELQLKKKLLPSVRGNKGTTFEEDLVNPDSLLGNRRKKKQDKAERMAQIKEGREVSDWRVAARGRDSALTVHKIYAHSYVSMLVYIVCFLQYYLPAQFILQERGKYGHRKGRLSEFASTTNKEKSKQKNPMMLKYRPETRRRIGESSGDKRKRVAKGIAKDKRNRKS